MCRASVAWLQIIEYSDANETAVCNLGSISLGKFVDPATRKFDYQKLMEVTLTHAAPTVCANMSPSRERRHGSQTWVLTR